MNSQVFPASTVMFDVGKQKYETGSSEGLTYRQLCAVIAMGSLINKTDHTPKRVAELAQQYAKEMVKHEG